MSFALTERLPLFDRQQLLTLRSNARRLQAEPGPRAEEASALLPLIEAELSRRAPPAPAAKRPRKKA